MSDVTSNIVTSLTVPGRLAASKVISTMMLSPVEPVAATPAIDTSPITAILHAPKKSMNVQAVAVNSVGS